MRAGLAVMAMVAALAGCAAPATTTACAPPAQRAPLIELFFGRGLPEGGTVSEAAWQDFAAEVLTPHFPDGLTVLDGAGDWRSGAGVAREASKLVIIVAPPSADLEARVDAVIATYKARFRQQAVLRVDGMACVSWR